MVPQLHVVQFCRNALKRPSVIALFVFIVLAEGVLNDGQLLKTVSTTTGWAILIGFGILAWITFYLFFPLIAWKLAVLNIPFWAAVFLTCLVISLEAVGAFIILLGHLQSTSAILTEFAKLFVLTLVAATIYLTNNHERDISILTKNDCLFPYWKPVPKQALKKRNDLPEMFNADVVMMKSFNQYIELYTSSSKRDARMSLTKAASYFDDTVGTRVHRSHWVRNDKMVAVHYRNGNPFLEVEGGFSVPVGRNMVDRVKKLIEDK